MAPKGEVGETGVTGLPRPVPPIPPSPVANFSKVRRNEQTANRMVDLISNYYCCYTAFTVYGSKPGLKLRSRLLRRQVNISAQCTRQFFSIPFNIFALFSLPPTK